MWGMVAALASVIVLGLEPGLYQVTDEGIRESFAFNLEGGQWVETETDVGGNGAALVIPDLEVVGTVRVEFDDRPPWAPLRTTLTWLILPPDSSPYWSNTVYRYGEIENTGEGAILPRVAANVRYVVTDWHWSYGTTVE